MCTIISSIYLIIYLSWKGQSFYLFTGVKPLNVREPIGSVVNVTCLCESSDKLTIRFIKNFSSHSIIIDEYGEMFPSVNAEIPKWEGEKKFTFTIDSSLKSVICQVVNENGTILAMVSALIHPGFVFWYRFFPRNNLGTLCYVLLSFLKSVQGENNIFLILTVHMAYMYFFFFLLHTLLNCIIRK